MTVERRAPDTDATGEETVRPVEELLDPGQGPLPLARFEEVTRASMITLGPLTDEELHWLTDVDEVATDELEAPRLGTLSAPAQRAALESTLTLLLARGDLVADVTEAGRDASVRAAGRHAVIAELRAAPLGMARVRTQDRDDAVSMAAVYHVTDELFLLEDVDPGGVHAFWLADAAHSRAWLAVRLDPWARARRRTDPVTAASVDELALDAAATADAELLTTVDLARAEHDQPLAAALTLWTSPEGVAVLALDPAHDERPGRVTYQQLDAAGIAELAEWCVEGVRPRDLGPRPR